MTTVVYRDGVMAADSLATQASTKCHGSYQKIHHIDDVLAGASGAVSDCEQFVRWLTEGDEEQPPKGEYSAIVVNKRGQILEIENGHYLPRPRGQKFAAIGSGSPFALAAMYAGADAITAVKIAIKIDVNSGGPVRSLTFK